MIRKGQIEDLEKIAGIVMQYRKFYGVENQDENEVRDFIKARIENCQSEIFIAENDDKEITGFIQLYPSYSTVSLKPQWVLNDFFVVPAERKKGTGRALMKAVKEYFKDSAKGFFLVTDKDNENAKKFYSANGWKSGEYDFYTYYYGTM